MLTITTPFWDGFFIGFVSGILIISLAIYLISRRVYSEIDSKEMPPQYGPISYKEFMDEWERSAYHS